MSWERRRRTFWRNATQAAGFFAVLFGVAGLATGDGTFIALAIPCAVLTLTFGRRLR